MHYLITLRLIWNLICSPQPPAESSEEKDDKSDFFPTDSENVNYIVHLNDTTFDEFIAQNAQSPILTMFYAPCELYRFTMNVRTVKEIEVVDFLSHTKPFCLLEYFSKNLERDLRVYPSFDNSVRGLKRNRHSHTLGSNERECYKITGSRKIVSSIGPIDLVRIIV